MQSLNDALELLKRQTALEKRMRQHGGMRVIDEQELVEVRRRWSLLPEATRTVALAANAMQTTVGDSRTPDGEAPPDRSLSLFIGNQLMETRRLPRA
jgi:hypothetical protein